MAIEQACPQLNNITKDEYKGMNELRMTANDLNCIQGSGFSGH